MTMSVKDEIERVWSIPNNLPQDIINIIAKRVECRTWDEVLEAQKYRWKTNDSKQQEVLDNETQKAYQKRYDSKTYSKDNKDWIPEPLSDFDKVSEFALNLKKISTNFNHKDIFRGIERGINFMLTSKQQLFTIPKAKVNGDFDDYSQAKLFDILSENPMPEVMNNMKSGIITDFLNSYENRDMSKLDREKGLQDIEKNFDGENKDEEIEGVIWHTKNGCDSCAKDGEFFELDDLPETHPNCRCSSEIKYKKDKKQPYIRIFVKDGGARHVRYEVVDADGNRIVRGLSTDRPFWGDSIYEKGEKDSHGISVGDKKYKVSDKIPLTEEELAKAQEHIAKLDENPPEYSAFRNNCADFAVDILSASGKGGCLGDYFTEEQEELNFGSDISDFMKCRIPQNFGGTIPDYFDLPEIEISKEDKHII